MIISYSAFLKGTLSFLEIRIVMSQVLVSCEACVDNIPSYFMLGFISFDVDLATLRVTCLNDVLLGVLLRGLFID